MVGDCTPTSWRKGWPCRGNGELRGGGGRRLVQRGGRERVSGGFLCFFQHDGHRQWTWRTCPSLLPRDRRHPRLMSVYCVLVLGEGAPQSVHAGRSDARSFRSPIIPGVSCASPIGDARFSHTRSRLRNKTFAEVSAYPFIWSRRAFDECARDREKHRGTAPNGSLCPHTARVPLDDATHTLLGAELNSRLGRFSAQLSFSRASASTMGTSPMRKEPGRSGSFRFNVLRHRGQFLRG
jgi:hypothetical protein